MSFPFSIPPLTQQFPVMGAADNLEWAEDAEVLRWFVRQRGGIADPARIVDAPLHRWISSLEAAGKGQTVNWVPAGERMRAGSAGGGEHLTAACDVYAAKLAAFSIRVIEGAHDSGRVEDLDVHQSFVTRELAGRDDQTADAPPFPAGVGTLWLSCRCARIGARRLQVLGNQSRAVDVKWATETGSVWFEVKHRSLARSLGPSTTGEATAKALAAKVFDAGRALRSREKEEGARALCVIFLAGVFPMDIARSFRGGPWLDALSNAFTYARTTAYHLPHAVILDCFGVDYEEGSTSALRLPHFVESPSARPRRSVDLMGLAKLIVADAKAPQQDAVDSLTE